MFEHCWREHALYNINKVNMYLQVLTYQTWEKNILLVLTELSLFGAVVPAAASHLCSFNKLHRDTHTAAAAAAVRTPQPKAEQTHHHVECDHGASLIQIHWDVKWNTDDFTANAGPFIQGVYYTA